MGFDEVLRHSLAFGVHPAKAALRLRVSLVGGHTKPLDGLAIVLGRSQSSIVEYQSKPALSAYVSLICCLPEPLDGLPVGLRYSSAVVVL